MGDQIMDLRTFGRTMLGRQPGYKPTKQELAADIALYKEYQKEAIKSARPGFTPSASEVTLPDGRKLAMVGTSPNSAMVAPSDQSWKPVKVIAPDGTVKLVDENTGRGITAWDETTGQPIRSATKETGDSIAGMQAAQLSQDIAKMQSQGAPWYRSDKSHQQDIATKQAQLNALLNPGSVLPGAQAPAPSSQAPAPTPQASPTPQATPTPDSAFLSSPMPSPDPAPQAVPASMSLSAADYQAKYGKAMKPGRYRTKSGAEVLITD